MIANPEFRFPGCGRRRRLHLVRSTAARTSSRPGRTIPSRDRPGEVLYVRDEETGELWRPTAAPIRDAARQYIARHGQGYSRFEHTSHGIALELLQYVPLDDPIKISRLKIRNISQAHAPALRDGLRRMGAGRLARRLARPSSSPRWIRRPVRCSPRNPWNTMFGARVAFADLGGQQTRWTARSARVSRAPWHARPTGRACRRGAAVQARGRGPRSLLRAADARRTGAGRDASRWCFSSAQAASADRGPGPARPLPLGRSRAVLRAVVAVLG